MTSLSCKIALCLGVVLAAGFGLAESGDYYPPADKDGGWRTLMDAAKIRKMAGMDLTRLDQAFEFEKETSQHGGLLVVRQGYLVYEKYFGRGNREAHPDMASIGKAFTSISCGIMLQEKHDRIPDGLETKVFTQQYLPQAFPLDDPAKADIKLGQLLSMSAGLHGEGGNPGIVNGVDQKLDPIARPTGPADQDLDALRTPLWTKPGAGYSYASNSPHIASIVLRNLTGMEMQQYILEKLARREHDREHRAVRSQPVSQETCNSGDRTAILHELAKQSAEQEQGKPSRYEARRTAHESQRPMGEKRLARDRSGQNRRRRGH